MVIVETPRLVLRHLEASDLEALFLLYRDPEIRRYFPDGTRTLAQTEEELNYFHDGHPEFAELGLWATVEKSTGAFLGRCGLLPWKIDAIQEVELAFLIAKERWREGFATEASRAIVEHARNVLRLERLICLILPENEASVGVARKVGMSYEREHRDEWGLCHIYSRKLRTAPVPRNVEVTDSG
jgi:[ribosomal protein S5]-alanine N-acetyltransferase